MKKILFTFAVGIFALALNAQSLKINNPFFNQVDYIGAFDGTNDWTAGWANWNPVDTEYPEATITKGNGAFSPSLSTHITSDETWSGVIKLDGWVYVDAPATLTIQPGTIIRGEAKSAVIIDRGAKIMAEGTVTQPIVFTSNQGAGFRNNSDWAGLIIAGKGINNLKANATNGTGDGEGLTEGGTGVFHGGSDNADNSGVLKYVRIEFPGYLVSEGNEINGLSLASVGSGTTIDYVQVSHSGDDGYEWWGGAVNAKHLISYKTEDDDFDTDNGFVGMVQFGVIARDSTIVDTDADNGFESDNDASGTNNVPKTNPTFSNISAFGPSKTNTEPANLLSNHNSGSAMRIRRGSCLQVYNSVFAGWGNGLNLESANGWASAQTDSLTVQNTNIAGVRNAWIKTSGGPVVADIATWFDAAARNNDTTLLATSLKLTDPFNYTARNFQPQAGSPVFDASIWYHLPVPATFPIDFEVENDATWSVFANGTGLPTDFEVIANPDKSGINTSDNVLKFVVNFPSDPWAGAVSEGYVPVNFTSSSNAISLMVWKSTISPVAFKVEASTNGGPVKEVKVTNTLTNQWELLTFDFSDCIGFSYPKIVIFPDFPATRTASTTNYMDNISLATTIGVSKNSTHNVKVYPNPAVDVLNVSLSYANAKVSVYNSLGRLMESVVAEGNLVRFDVSNYSRGIYFVKINDEAVVKFVK